MICRDLRACSDFGTAERDLNGLVGRSQIKKFANDVMKTKDVRLDVKLNKAVWGKGVRNVSLPIIVSGAPWAASARRELADMKCRSCRSRGGFACALSASAATTRMPRCGCDQLRENA